MNYCQAGVESIGEQCALSACADTVEDAKKAPHRSKRLCNALSFLCPKIVYLKSNGPMVHHAIEGGALARRQRKLASQHGCTDAPLSLATSNIVCYEWGSRTPFLWFLQAI